MTRSKFLTATASAVAIAAGFAAAPASALEVRLARVVDTDRYDPVTSTARATAEVLFMGGDTLVTLGYDMKSVEPGLAESWTVSEDGKTYTFTLKEGIEYCSGRPLTASDIAFHYDRWMEHERGVTKWRAGDIDEVVADGDRTVVYKLNEPYSELLFQMTQHNHVVVNPDQVEEMGDEFGSTPFDGTGPFCMQSWEPRNQVVMTKNENYAWGPPQFSNQTAQVDSVIWRIVPEDNTRIAAMRSGDIDATQYVPYFAVADFEEDENFAVSEAEAYFWTHYVGFKITRDNVSDVRVRKAINLAVDTASIADGVFFGYAEPANAYIHPDVLDFNPDLDTSVFETYDPEAAGALLDEAGWTLGDDGFRYNADGDKLELRGLSFSAGNSLPQMEAIQGDLREVGIDLKVEPHDATVIWGLLAQQDFDMYTMSYPYVSASDGLNLYFRSANMPTPNRMNWDDELTDELLEKASAALTDEERAGFLAQVQERVHAGVVWIPTAHEPLLITSNSSKLQPVRAHGIYGAGFYKGLELAPAE